VKSILAKELQVRGVDLEASSRAPMAIEMSILGEVL
jgi:hypothetical protein